MYISMCMCVLLISIWLVVVWAAPTYFINTISKLFVEFIQAKQYLHLASHKCTHTHTLKISAFRRLSFCCCYCFSCCYQRPGISCLLWSNCFLPCLLFALAKYLCSHFLRNSGKQSELVLWTDVIQLSCLIVVWLYFDSTIWITFAYSFAFCTKEWMISISAFKVNIIEIICKFCFTPKL